ncbi:polyketide cyclase [Modestobacter sp. I12A-02628]|uniref:Polyketide cyclase n=1 Tax=Goekera deserti TaxID=2497753 RepID=A0A7K3WDM1_9ACTN|nr:SRPBCC family protein [Goekera deserti]MPQ97191.1 polyketide cyclase [Goekera deserti]NDI46491.1 polyketide cyclase [Goekera deserti]NEL54575.1 polyketide cyclase [Goekera deserti]
MPERQTFQADATVTVDAELHDIWAVWVDARAWTTWDDSLAAVDIDGNFKEGATLTLTPTSGDPVQATLVSVTQGEEFTDEVELPFGVVRTSHRMGRVGDLAQITHAVTAEVDTHHVADFATTVWPELRGGVAASLTNLAEIVGD